MLLRLQTLVSCLGRMWRTPFPTIFTVACVGVILSLPAGLYMMSVNLLPVTGILKNTPELTMYLSKNANDDLSARLFDQVRNLPQVHHVRLVSADEALEDFKQLTGLDTIIQYVPDNPLPTVIIVQPYEKYANPTDFQQLADKLRGFELVDAVEVDLQWVKRLYKIIELARIGFTIVSVLLIAAAILLICNTTRLSIVSRYEEIKVIDQIGGTRAFIRRPFVYIAVIHSLLSVAVALAIIEGIRMFLKEPISELATLYSSDYQLSGLSPLTWLGAVATVSILSWLASRTTVHIYLRRLKSSQP